MNQRTATTTAGTVPEDGSPPAAGRTLFDRASQVHRRGQPGEALELLDQLLADEPDNVAAQYARAICLADLGRTREATAQFRTVLARDPRHYEAAYQLGRTLQATADLTGAIDAYRAVLAAGNYRDTAARLRDCENALLAAGAAPAAGSAPGAGPTPLRTRIDAQGVVDRGIQVGLVRLQARNLVPRAIAVLLGAGTLTLVLLSLLFAAFSQRDSRVSAPVLTDLAVSHRVALSYAIFAVSILLCSQFARTAAALLAVAVVALIGTTQAKVVHTPHLRVTGSGFSVGPLLDYSGGSLFLRYYTLSWTAIFLYFVGAAAVIAACRHLNGAVLYEYGLDVRDGFLRRSVQFIWYYQITEPPIYRRTMTNYLANTASMSISYNESGAASVRKIDLTAIGKPADVLLLGRRLESRVLVERARFRGPWT
ncbi:tetratricopeptide repeat protein [Frankia sp. Mgl5]|uniref:tetratricopeptide repeat protein n=1 Tax=Frankia sp. Mgl5 TaxID=2933793 RepID=UPI00200E7A25|nr:tetratricopeptide repeat protein [Frankia sp. Mgl5]MCK9930490.1 tetratricopeptide repeat protein [Frankia sp. Mgl5]